VDAVGVPCWDAKPHTRAWQYQEVLMSGRTLWIVALLGCLVTVLPLLGCALFTDMLNPDFLSALGVDPATVISSQGRLVIAFDNATQFTLSECFVSIADAPDAPTEDFQTVSVRDIPANETRSRVLDCPVQVVLPGSATVQQNGTETTVDYAGAPMLLGYDFLCGDVIEMRVVQSGEDAASADFAITVRVLAGR
jgi:hypothetical protein